VTAHDRIQTPKRHTPLETAGFFLKETPASRGGRRGKETHNVQGELFYYPKPRRLSMRFAVVTSNPA